MSGLLEKDIRLLKQRKTTLIIFIGLAFIMSFSMDSSFLISYFSMMGCIFALSTISYDEFENGYAFLMTLPITPRLYVIEKYVFSAVSMSIFAVCAFILDVISCIVQHTPYVLKDMLLDTLLYLPIFLLVMGLYIPIQLKFGAEKSRLAIFGICGVIFVIGAFSNKLIGSLSPEARQSLANLLIKLQSIPLELVIGLFGIVFLALTALSMLISIRIMQKKEY